MERSSSRGVLISVNFNCSAMSKCINISIVILLVGAQMSWHKLSANEHTPVRTDQECARLSLIFANSCTPYGSITMEMSRPAFSKSQHSPKRDHPCRKASFPWKEGIGSGWGGERGRYAS